MRLSSSGYQRIVRWHLGRSNGNESSGLGCFSSGKRSSCLDQSSRCCFASRDLLLRCVGNHSLLRSHVGHSREDRLLSGDFQWCQIRVWSQMVFESSQCLRYLKSLAQYLHDSRKFFITYQLQWQLKAYARKLRWSLRIRCLGHQYSHWVFVCILHQILNIY